MNDAKPVTSAQRDATIDDVRRLLDGDPLDVVSLYRGHLAIVVGALDEARREAAFRIDRERSIIDACERVPDGGQYRADIVDAIERIRRERDEARAALAGEPARIAAAEMARDVAWVRACDVNDGTANIRRGLGLRDKHKAWTIVLLAQGTGSTATDADIAAAIRAARGAR